MSMREDFNLMPFMLGLSAGIVFALIVLYFVVKKGKKERRFDERYQRIQEQSKSLAWGITVLAILIAWTIVIIFEGPGLAYFLFTAVYVIAMVSYGITAAIMEKKS